MPRPAALYNRRKWQLIGNGAAAQIAAIHCTLVNVSVYVIVILALTHLHCALTQML